MTDLEKLQEVEIANLKGLLKEVYEMSCLDDMITDGCLDRKDDEILLCHLSLKSQIMEALHGKNPFSKSSLGDLKKSINGKKGATA